MKYTILTFLLLLCLGSQAQKLRYTDKRNHWISKGTSGFDQPCSHTRFLSIGTDTIISGRQYSRFVDWIWDDPCGIYPFPSIGVDSFSYFVREDTMAGLVYGFCINPALDVYDTIEHLWFNYNLHVGDTVTNVFPGTTTTFIDTVTAVDSFIINGVYHKTWGFGIVNPALEVTVCSYGYVEGFGSYNYPFYHFNICFESGEQMVCFYQTTLTDTNYITVDGSVSWTDSSSITSWLGVSTTEGCPTVGIHDIIKSIPSISTYPNPASTILNVDMKNVSGESGQISVYDIQGRCVYHDVGPHLQEQTTINTSTWLSGIYLLVIQNETGILKEEKIMIER